MDKSAPRFQAGSMSIPEGAGDITAMCSCGDFLEIYTEHATYRVRSPESIDPGLTNPNAPWVSAKASDFGSSSKIVARVLLQGEPMIKSASLSDHVADKEDIIRQLHSCKEALLACEKVRLRVSGEIERIINKMSINGVEVEHGRHIKALPQVPNLDDDASTFLINIKRTIACICHLAPLFLPLPKRDNNLDHLKKSIGKLSNERHSTLLAAIDQFCPGSKHLIELRNYQEHPGELRTHVNNFSITANNEISYPVWFVSGKPPEPILASMNAAVDFAISLCETLLVHLIFAAMETKIPYFVQEIPDEDMESKLPIKYRLSIEISER